MTVLLLAQILAVLLAATLATGALRRMRTLQVRRAAAFEDFAEGRGLHLYRVANEAPVYRLTDDLGTVITVETAPAPLLRRGRKAGTVTLTLAAPRLVRGFAAMVAGVEAGGPDRGQRLDRALRGIGSGNGPVPLRVLPVGEAVALLADVPSDQTPDLEAMRAALADPALRPEGAGTAMIALNPEGLHLRLGRSISDPRELAPILEAMRTLRLRLEAGLRRRAA